MLLLQKPKYRHCGGILTVSSVQSRDIRRALAREIREFQDHYADTQQLRWKRNPSKSLAFICSVFFQIIALTIALGLMLKPGVSMAQQADIDAATAAKAAAGREALTHAPINSPGPKAVGTFITFDAPGTFQGTFPSSINPAGAITGYYYEANSVPHGFLRASNGTFMTFDAPGAFQGISPTSISQAGAITGYYNDANSLSHGFLRASDGTFTTFDVPGAEFGIFPACINPEGVITGWYYDANFVSHAFLRTRNGTLTTFDAPEAGTTGGEQGT
jgi:hypothetical protein